MAVQPNNTFRLDRFSQVDEGAIPRRSRSPIATAGTSPAALRLSLGSIGLSSAPLRMIPLGLRSWLRVPAPFTNLLVLAQT